MITIQDAKYEDEYRIWIRFNTGETGIVDLSDVIKKYPAANSLLNQAEFAKFYLDDWPTIAWSSGFDLSPETIYERVTGKPPVWRRLGSE